MSDDYTMESMLGQIPPADPTPSAVVAPTGGETAVSAHARELVLNALSSAEIHHEVWLDDDAGQAAVQQTRITADTDRVALLRYIAELESRAALSSPVRAEPTDWLHGKVMRFSRKIPIGAVCDGFLLSEVEWLNLASPPVRAETLEAQFDELLGEYGDACAFETGAANHGTHDWVTHYRREQAAIRAKAREWFRSVLAERPASAAVRAEPTDEALRDAERYRAIRDALPEVADAGCTRLVLNTLEHKKGWVSYCADTRAEFDDAVDELIDRAEYRPSVRPPVPPVRAERGVAERLRAAVDVLRDRVACSATPVGAAPKLRDALVGFRLDPTFYTQWERNRVALVDVLDALDAALTPTPPATPTPSEEPTR